MRRIIFAAVTGSFAALIAPSALQAQEEAPPPVGIAVHAPGAPAIVRYFECDMTREARADTLVMEVIGPVYDRYLSEGKLISWGWLAHYLGGKWRRLSFAYATDPGDLLDTNDEIIAELVQEHPEANREFLSICPVHEDYIWNTRISRP